MQQKSVHLSLLRFRSFIFLGMEDTGIAHISGEMFRGILMEGLCCVLWIVILLEYSSAAKFPETGSHLVSQYFGIFPQAFMVRHL